MHDVMRQRILRRLETLPEAQLYQIMDYIEFLESKYAERSQIEPSVLQKFAEGVEDKLRKKAMNPNTLREAFQLISVADKVLADVSSAGKQILDELGGLAEPQPTGKQVTSGGGERSSARTRRPGAPPGPRPVGERPGAPGKRTESGSGADRLPGGESPRGGGTPGGGRPSGGT
jgi:hypothetical protein